MSCYNKQRFASRADAKAHAREVSRGSSFGPSSRGGSGKMHPYFCSRYCNAWHLTHFSKAEAKRKGFT